MAFPKTATRPAPAKETYRVLADIHIKNIFYKKGAKVQLLPVETKYLGHALELDTSVTQAPAKAAVKPGVAPTKAAQDGDKH